MPLRLSTSLFALLGLSLLPAGPLLSESPAVPLGLSGAPGIVDVPTAGALPFESLSFSKAGFGPVRRGAIGFQAAPWLHANLRSHSVSDWGGPESHFDRSLDLHFTLREETAGWPAIALGLQDLFDPGLTAGEYLVATRHFGPVAVTAGLGWGRLASRGALGEPFGPRPASSPDDGLGNDQLFRGPVAPFGGLAWQVNDRWTAKIEYSSDAYAVESGERGTFEVRSPLNVGLEYSPSPMIRLGAYAIQGSQIGLAAQVILDPRRRPSGAIGGTGPEPVKPRPARAADPEAWSPEWVDQEGAGAILLENLAAHVKRSGLVIESLGYDATVAQVRFRNAAFDAEAQAIGRIARALSQVMPASVEVFEIVPMVDGLPAGKVVLRRSDVEALEFAPGGDATLRDRAVLADAGPAPANLTQAAGLYPDFAWSLAPYARLDFFDPASDVAGEAGLRLSARYDLAPGVTLAGAVTKSLLSLPSSAPSGAEPGLPPVRSEAERYRANGDPGIETLTASWQARIGPDLFGRVTLGYLEEMYGGVATEVLWMPAGRRWALGAEADLLAQRDSDGGLGFDEFDYQVLSGHVSGYVDLGQGYQGRLDLGRYLAGDLGGTLALSRRFENGWEVGGWLTRTDATPSGAVTGGLSMTIPMTWLTGQPGRGQRVLVLQESRSDAGARLWLEGRLHDQVIDYSAQGLDEQWGRFWK